MRVGWCLHAAAVVAVAGPGAAFGPAPPSSIYGLLNDRLLPRDPAVVLAGCVGPNCTGDSAGEPTRHPDEQVLQRPFDLKTSFLQRKSEVPPRPHARASGSSSTQQLSAACAGAGRKVHPSDQERPPQLHCLFSHCRGAVAHGVARPPGPPRMSAAACSRSLPPPPSPNVCPCHLWVQPWLRSWSSRTTTTGFATTRGRSAGSGLTTRHQLGTAPGRLWRTATSTTRSSSRRPSGSSRSAGQLPPAPCPRASCLLPRARVPRAPCPVPAAGLRPALPAVPQCRQACANARARLAPPLTLCDTGSYLTTACPFTVDPATMHHQADRAGGVQRNELKVLRGLEGPAGRQQLGVPAHVQPRPGRLRAGGCHACARRVELEHVQHAGHHQGWQVGQQDVGRVVRARAHAPPAPPHPGIPAPPPAVLPSSPLFCH